MAGRQHHAGTSLRVRTGDGAVVVVRVEGRLAGDPGRLTIEDRANTRGLALHTRRAGGPVEGLEVELVRTGLFGDEASTGLAFLPDDRGAPVWLRAPERSDAGRILTGVVEGLAAPELPLEARLWHAHRTREAGGEVERLAATWQGPGAEDPRHTELHWPTTWTRGPWSSWQSTGARTRPGRWPMPSTPPACPSPGESTPHPGRTRRAGPARRSTA